LLPPSVSRSVGPADLLLTLGSSVQVDEIMMTLKQAFTVAAVQQTAKAPAQLCEGCPLQGLHKLCERIEGE
jgi:TBC1 domain family protein 1